MTLQLRKVKKKKQKTMTGIENKRLERKLINEWNNICRWKTSKVRWKDTWDRQKKNKKIGAERK